MNRRQKTRKIIFYTAVVLMIPTFLIAIFFRQEYPVLGPVLAICGIVLLALVSFIDFKGRK